MRARITYTGGVILLAGLLPTYGLRFSMAGIPTNFFEVAIGLVAVAGLLQADVRRQWAAAWRTLSRPVIWLVAGFILAALLSMFVSPHLRTSLGILKGWVISPLLLGWQVYTVGDNDVGRRKIIRSVLLSGVVVALLGISQLGVLERVRSIYDVPNSLALYLVPIFMLALGSREWWQAGVMGMAILATQSLGAVLSVIITTLFALGDHRSFVRRGKIWILLTLSVLGFVLWPRLVYLTAPLRDRTVHNSVSVRIQLWDVSWQLIREHPLLGIGLGTFEPAYQVVLATRQGIIPEYIFRDPHNWVLSFWLNTGLLGLISFVGLNAWVLWRQLKFSIFNFQFSISAALIALLLFGFVDTIYWKNDLAALHWILLALGAGASSRAGLSPRTGVSLTWLAHKIEGWFLELRSKLRTKSIENKVGA